MSNLKIQLLIPKGEPKIINIYNEEILVTSLTALLYLILNNMGMIEKLKRYLRVFPMLSIIDKTPIFLLQRMVVTNELTKLKYKEIIKRLK